MINIDLTKEQGVNIEFTSNIVYGGEGGKTVDVVQSTGSSKNAVMSQDAVTRELSNKTDKSDVYTKTEVDDKLKNVDVDLSEYATKNYVEQEIGKIDIPNTDNLETKSDANAKLEEAKSYTDEKFKSIDIPELPTLAKVAETGDYNDLENKPTIPDVSGFVTEDAIGEFVTVIAGLVEAKADKTSVITSEDINNVTLDWDKEYHFTMTKDISLGFYDKPNDDYAHSIEIEMTTGEDTYSFSTNLEIQWVKDLEIEANKRYMIIIDDSMTAMWVAVERSDNE